MRHSIQWRSCAKALVFAIGVALIPISLHAQSIRSSVAGEVTDSSGGVLPGVTVEVSSPVLIEKVRTGVTDGSGLYRIIDLPPGTYTVTFALPGFSTFRREGLELSGSIVATVDAQLRVGALEETITVTGESPTVDVETVKQTQVLDNTILADMPLERTATGIASTLVPAMNAGLSAYGAGAGPETGRLQVDGVGVGSGTSGTSQYRPDTIQATELVISSFGNLGEAEVGSPIVNVIPRVGGNTFSGTFYADGANGALGGDNTEDLVASGVLRAPNDLIHTTQVNLGLGGPILKDRLWYFGTVRHQTDDSYVTNMWANKNAGDGTKWTYDPDYDRRATNDSWYANGSIRFTWQANQKNKFNFFWDEQRKCERCSDISTNSSTTSPEASSPGYIPGIRQYWRVQQINWTSPLTNKLFLDVGIGYPNSLYGKMPTADDLRLTQANEQGGLIPGLTYRAETFSRNRGGLVRWMGSASYITGPHSIKVGFDGERFHQIRQLYTQQDGLSQFRFNNGTATRLTMTFNDWRYELTVPVQAYYVQDSSTFGRLTLHGGLRLDHATSFAPEQNLNANAFVPQPILFPTTEVVHGFYDLSPRFGVAYDVRGDGKTAVRVSLGRYLAAVNADGIYASTAPVALIGGGGARTAPTTTRSWGDTNRNFRPDCDLMNKAKNGECGAWGTQNFGEFLPSNVDPRLTGNDGMWYRRPYDWGFGVTVQHELIPRLSVDGSYNKRWWGNDTIVDNLLVGPVDYDDYSVTAPTDQRLPDGGGYVVSDLWAVTEAKFGATNNYEVPDSDFGKNVRYFHAVDFNLRGETRGFTFRVGTSTGREVRDTCELIYDSPSLRNCHTALPFQTTFSSLVSYIVRKVDVQLSGVFRSSPGTEILANTVYSSAEVQKTLGRPLPGNAANVTINILDPGDMYRERINNMDLRVAKLFRFDQKRLNVGVDIFNALNSSVVLNSNNTYGSAWLTPTLVQSARQAQISAKFDF
ncbi:MAG TPA: carboxypeptidase-like regulatory domain-containing protein [Vicinamibacterales bacterium]|nr:carboxypeptidase-like regulatory domain-containing protein [Vicinamibacterales bacterium]